MVPLPPASSESTTAELVVEVTPHVEGDSEGLIMSLPRAPTTTSAAMTDRNPTMASISGGGDRGDTFDRHNILGGEQGFYGMNRSISNDEDESSSPLSPKLQLLTSSPTKGRRPGLSPARSRQSVALESRIRIFESSNSFKNLDSSYNDFSSASLGGRQGSSSRKLGVSNGFNDSSNHTATTVTAGSMTSPNVGGNSTPRSAIIKDRIKIFDSSRCLVSPLQALEGGSIHDLLSPTSSHGNGPSSPSPRSSGGRSSSRRDLAQALSSQRSNASAKRLPSIQNLNNLSSPGGSLSSTPSTAATKASVNAAGLKKLMMASPGLPATSSCRTSSASTNSQTSSPVVVKNYNEAIDKPSPKHVKELYKLRQDLKQGRVKNIATECFSRRRSSSSKGGRSWLLNQANQRTNASNRVGGLSMLDYLSPEEIQQKKRQSLRKDLEWTLKNAWKRMKNQELLKSRKRRSSIHQTLNLTRLDEMDSQEIVKQRKIAIKKKDMEWNLRNNAWKNVRARPLSNEYIADFEPPVHRRKSAEQIDAIKKAMSKSFVLKDVLHAGGHPSGSAGSISSGTTTPQTPNQDQPQQQHQRLPSNLQDEIKLAVENKIEIVTSKSAVPLTPGFLDEFKAPLHEKDGMQVALIQQAMSKSVVLKDCISTAASTGGAGLAGPSKVETNGDAPASLTSTGSAFPESTTEICDTLIQAMEPIEVNKGEVIVEQGMGGSDYFIVSEGEVDFKVDGKIIGKAKRGDSFFDLNLLYNAPHPATVVATSSSSKLFRVDQQTFRGIMETTHRQQQDFLNKPRMASLVEDPIQEGDEDDNDDDEDEGNDVVGELGGRFSNSQSKTKDAYRMSMFGVQDSAIMLHRAAIHEAIQTTVALNDLKKISLLGEGQFGEVWLVQTTILDDEVHQFALKSQYREDEMRGESTEETIRREIEVLKQLQHPFICDLIHEYGDVSHIHILLGLVTGGELWDLVHQEDEDGNWSSGLNCEEDAKFYSLVIADTLAFMHSKCFIYRDLKPENVMIDSDGYPILVDFGFAKQLRTERSKTFTFCGTPNYVSPEIIKNCGHNAGADHWAFGCLLYEFLSGQNPFYYDGMDTTELFRTICDEMYYGMDEGQASAEAMDLIDLLLTKDPFQRIGMLRDGSADILEHEWFNGIDIVKLRQKLIAAPWIPGSTEKVELEFHESAKYERVSSSNHEDAVPPMRTGESIPGPLAGRWIYGEGGHLLDDPDGDDDWETDLCPGPTEEKDECVRGNYQSDSATKQDNMGSEPCMGRWIYGEGEQPEAIIETDGWGNSAVVSPG